jgi:hypothetical protein
VSFKSWWEERKRLQEEREARQYAFEDGSDDEVWVDPEDTDETVPVADGADEATSETDPDPADDAAAAAEEPPVFAESWWKRRLLGEPERSPAEEAAPETEPLAEEPDSLAEDVEPEPVTGEPEREPVAEEPEPEPEPELVAQEPESEPQPEPDPLYDADDPGPGEVFSEDAEPPTQGVDAELPYEEIVDEEALVAYDAGDVEEDPVAEVLYQEPGPHEAPYSYPDEDELFDEPLIAAVDPDATTTPVGTDVPGPRRARLEGERRRRRRKELGRGAVAAAIAAVVGLVGLISIMSRDEAPAPPPGLVAGGADEEDTIRTTLVFGTRERSPGEPPKWMVLLSTDTATGRCSVVYIPAHTATGVPGRGLLAIGDALESGGVPLLLLATETLLGTPVDRYLELSDADAAVLFGETGPLTVDVPDDVRVAAGPGQARLVFSAGPQRLRPELLADLLYVKGLDVDDIELGARHISFWTSLLEAFAFDADGLGRAVERAGAAVGESDASPAELARLFERLAAAKPEDRTLALLPVRQVGVGGSELYQVDGDEVRKFLAETVGAQAVSGREVRVQILNGNGSPGVGQLVAERLGGEGFRVILSGNARRLNYRETLVITYDRSSKGVGLAEKTRDLIGVGEVQVAAQSQGIVDLTIVVGKDFLQTL